MDYVKGKCRNQVQIMKSLDEYIKQNNVVRIIDAFVNSLDIKALEFKNSVLNTAGRPPYDPKDMLKLYIYGMENGITSSRKLERECCRNIELMWLVNEIEPENKTICNFRKDNSKPLVNTFKKFCHMLKDWGLIDGKIMALDGTKIRANNSKKNNFSIKKLNRSIAYIDEKIAKYMLDIDENDNNEESTQKLTAEMIQQKIIELRNRKDEYSTYIQKIEQGETNEISTIDTDARLMCAGNNGIDVSYNIQTMVDAKHKLIAGAKVINNAADAGQLGIVPNDIKTELQLTEMTVLADKGFYKTEDFKTCEEQGITTIVAKPNYTSCKIGFKYDSEENIYICPAGNKLYPGKVDSLGFRRYKNRRVCTSCPHLVQCTKGKPKEICRHIHADSAERNDLRLHQNLELYKQRQMIVEHPFGTVKRTMGIRQFLTRGLTKVSGEVALIYITYNLKRLKNILNFDDLMRKIQDSSLSSFLYKHLLSKIPSSISFHQYNNYYLCFNSAV